jgi:sugar/nucleoside kinase (ribokinase family)
MAPTHPQQKEKGKATAVKNKYDVLMIGHFAKDRLVIDGQGHNAAGGAVYYGSMAIRRLGVRVAVVTRLAERDFPMLEEVRQAGIDVSAAKGPTTSGIENIYHSADMERRFCHLIGFAGPFQQQDIPAWPAKIIAVTPIIAGEVDLPLLRHLSTLAPLALDVQGFVRVPQGKDLIFHPWEQMAEGLKLITYLKVDRAEAELLTGLQDIPSAARALAAYGPQEVVVTQSAGVTVLAEGKLHFAPFTPHSLAGRTGRGDTCFAAYLAMRLQYEPQEALLIAAAVTTLKQEQPGPWRGEMADARQQIETWRQSNILRS